MVHESLGASTASWAGKTAPEIRELGERPGSVLVIPIGSIEQHGKHLPVSTDTLLASAVATTGAEAVEDTVPILVAPPIYPGYSPHHLSFGGTLTVGLTQLLETIIETAGSAVENEFDAVLLLNGHGGNIPVIGAATSVFGVDHPETTVYGISYFELAAPFIDEIRESESGGMGHAGEFETSLMLHLRPDLVGSSRDGTLLSDPQDLALQDMFEGGPLGVYRPFEAYTETGTIGDPSTATADKGAAILEGLEEELAALLLDIHDEVR